MVDAAPAAQNGLVIYAKDVATLAEFYRSVLALEIVATISA